MRKPEFACVVLSVGNPPELRAAVTSLLDQDEPVEIVVVNSGGGNAARSLADLTGVRLLEFEERLLPGGARNRGIEATSARYVAFLAADCIAEEGWVRERMILHREGAEAVASSVTNPFRRNLAAWTSYISLFNRRMPGAPQHEVILFGLSYDRRLFERFGLFREDMRGAEDTEFNERLRGHVDIRWAPKVRTAHRHSRSIANLIHDHFRRGRRAAVAWEQMRKFSTLQIARIVLMRAPSAVRNSWHAAEPGEKKWIAAAAMLLVLPTLAYALGTLTHALAPAKPTDE